MIRKKEVMQFFKNDETEDGTPPRRRGRRFVPTSAELELDAETEEREKKLRESPSPDDK